MSNDARNADPVKTSVLAAEETLIKELASEAVPSRRDRLARCLSGIHDAMREYGILDSRDGRRLAADSL